MKVAVYIYLVASLGALAACTVGQRPAALNETPGHAAVVPPGLPPPTSQDGAADAPGATPVDPLDAGAVDAADGSIDADADPPDVAVDPICSATPTWSGRVLHPISNNGLDEYFGSVTPDELTIAWTTESGHVRYSDRASIGVDFQTPKPIPGNYAVDRVALSTDGLRLVIVASNRRSFLEATRSSRNDPFDAPSTGDFANVNEYAATSMPAQESFGDPMLGPDDRVLYYSQYGGGRTRTIFVTQRVFLGDPWPEGAPLNAVPLEAQAIDGGVRRKRLTGISSDLRTLFFWDELTGTERAGFLSPNRDVFTGFIDLGARMGAAPSAACDRIYFSAGGQNSVDLFHEGAQ